MRIRGHIACRAVGLGDLVVHGEVSRLTDGLDHLFLRSMAVDRVVRAVMLHCALEVRRHHANRDR